MRVITGTARGRRLKELEGMETRPTTDRVKEGLFSARQFDIEGRRVLDLFAGTGQLGIECLSRGAASAVFVDRRADAVKLIRENLKLTELQDRARVVAGEGEAPYLTGAQKSLRLCQAEALQPTLPPEARAWGEAFCRRLAAVEPVPVHQTVTDGDLLPWCGGCRVVATPGHTPGHCSLYLPGLRAVVTGDAAVLEAGAPAVANPHFTLDLPQAEASLQKLLALDAYCWLCYHGGLRRR